MKTHLDGDVMIVAIDPMLPCGMEGCCNTTATAQAERDPATPGLWILLPICDACLSRLRSRSIAGTASLPGQPV